MGLLQLLQAAICTAKDSDNDGADRPSKPSTSKPGRLKRRSRKPQFECMYCYSLKDDKDFVKGSLLPWNCQPHLTGPHNRVCKECMEASIRAQMDCKMLLDIGCPQCGTAWEPDEVRLVVGAKERKKLVDMDRVAQRRTFTPADLPDQPTLDDMLARGTRLCPGCLFPFLKLGGCDSMLCGKCGKYFHVAYAPVLEDGQGHRAVDVNEDSNTDLLWVSG